MLDLVIGISEFARSWICMELSNEDKVTRLLSNHEILQHDFVEELFEGRKRYATNPKYDLTSFLNSIEQEPRYEDKYLFVK